MKWSLVALTGSVIAVVLGFTLVILFSKIYVVPHLLTQDFYRTRCRILNITNMSRQQQKQQQQKQQQQQHDVCNPVSNSNLNSNLSASAIPSSKLDSNSSFKQTGYVNHKDECKNNWNGTNNGVKTRSNFTDLPCVTVEVSYTNYDSQKQVGKLLADEMDQINEGRALDSQCFCHGCKLSIVTSGDGTVTSLAHAERVLRVGAYVRCYFIMPHRTTLSVSETSNWVVLNAILWPSLLFIAGFVGLFFSCVFLQADRAKALQKKKARRRALDRSV